VGVVRCSIFYLDANGLETIADLLTKEEDAKIDLCCNPGEDDYDEMCCLEIKHKSGGK
jgi:hypothetical protein